VKCYRVDRTFFLWKACGFASDFTPPKKEIQKTEKKVLTPGYQCGNITKSPLKRNGKTQRKKQRKLLLTQAVGYVKINILPEGEAVPCKLNNVRRKKSLVEGF